MFFARFVYRIHSIEYDCFKKHVYIGIYLYKTKNGLSKLINEARETIIIILQHTQPTDYPNGNWMQYMDGYVYVVYLFFKR
jgi:hypothetical protein